MIDLIKKIIFYFWNPVNVRDSRGRIVDDIKRKRQSSKTKKEILLKDPKGLERGPKCFRIITKGRVDVIKREDLLKRG